MPTCSCGLTLEPINFHRPFDVAGMTFDGNNAELIGLSREDGLLCPVCLKIFGFNGCPEPILVIATNVKTSATKPFTYTVERWRPNDNLYYLPLYSGPE